MKVILLITLALASHAAYAATAKPTVQYDQFFATATGRKLTNSDALSSAMKGDLVYKCQSVEAHESKRGDSIVLRPVKKVKSGV